MKKFKLSQRMPEQDDDDEDDDNDGEHPKHPLG